MADCGHPEVRWEMATNEDGWRCDVCDAKLGFRPDLDMMYTDAKAETILHALHDAGVVYVSNGTQGEVIARNVERAAAKPLRFDQYTLAALILSDSNLARHGDYWAKRAEEWLEAERNGVEHETPVDQQLRQMGAAPLPGLF